MIAIPRKTDLPKIVIIGKQNVGKSTLFNRLLGKRRSITDSRPGVTRDSVEVEVELEDRMFLLIDTGGFNTEKGDYNQIVSQKSIDMATKADLLLLLVDVNEIGPNDFDFVEKVRPFKDKIILVVNKVDNDKLEMNIWNFFKLGFKRVVGISSVHGRNIQTLTTEILIFFKDFKKLEKDNSPRPIRFSILGKPNTGKSSLTNFLLGEEKSLVSHIPGTTRDVIEGKFMFQENLFQVLDTAGIRKKKKVVDSLEYYSVNRAIKSIRESDIVLLLVDSIEEISEQDKKIAQLAVKKGKGIIIVLSKWDLLKKVPNRIIAMKDKIHFFFPILSFAPVIPISSKTGYGVKDLLNIIIKIWKQLNIWIETPVLNSTVNKWNDLGIFKANGKLIKIRYCSQISTNPVKFVFFISRLKGFRLEYQRFIQNKIRNNFPFANIPIEIDFKGKKSN